MKYFKYLIVLVIAFSCGNEKRNSSTVSTVILPTNNMIDSLVEKIKMASLHSIEDQIESTVFEKDQIDRLNSLAKGFSDTSSVRNDFFLFIKDELGNQLISKSEIYLIELERSGEIFQASNFVVFSGESSEAYRYDFENGHWRSNGRLELNFSLHTFFDGLKYRNQCDKADYASIDNLIITRIIDAEVKSKVITILCKKEIPIELLTVL